MKNNGNVDFFRELENYTVLLKAVAYILEHKYNMLFFTNKLEIQMQHLLYIYERINQYMQSDWELSPEDYCKRSQGLKTFRKQMPFRSSWSASLPVEWLQSDEDDTEDNAAYPSSMYLRIFYGWYPADPFINSELGVTKIIQLKEN